MEFRESLGKTWIAPSILLTSNFKHSHPTISRFLVNYLPQLIKSNLFEWGHSSKICTFSQQTQGAMLITIQLIAFSSWMSFINSFDPFNSTYGPFNKCFKQNGKCLQQLLKNLQLATSRLWFQTCIKYSNLYIKGLVIKSRTVIGRFGLQKASSQLLKSRAP